MIINKKQLICLVLLITGFNSCEKPKSIFDFEENKKPIYRLAGQKHDIPQLLVPYKLESKSEVLLVFESYRVPPDHPLIHIIKKSDLNYIIGKGVIGYGPNEIADADVYDPGFSDSTFWINSIISKKLAKFNLYNDSKLSELEFRQPVSMQLATKVFNTVDSTFICHVSTDAYNFVEFDRSGNRIGGYGLKKPIKRVINDGSMTNNFIIAQVNKGILKKDPFTQIYVKAGIYTDRLDIFNYQTKKIIQINGPRTELPDFEIVGSGNNIGPAFPRDLAYGHRDIDFSKRYIYDLYGGYSEVAYRKTEILAKTVYILTKKGEMVARLDLDKSVISITVDEKLGKIYGITTDKEPGIAVFDIPKELLD